MTNVISPFPMNVVECIKSSLEDFFPDRVIVDRPLRSIDPSRAIGVFVSDWIPEQGSYQIGQVEPALSTYAYRIHNMVKAGDEVTGRRTFSIDSKSIRAVLYRDPALLIRLRALSEVILSTREVFQRMIVTRQRFVNSEFKKNFLYVATTEISVTTESIQL